jgi:maltose-binding protein MalE
LWKEYIEKMEDFMKKYFIVTGLLFVSFSVFAQLIDKSQYKEIDLFSYQVEGNQEGRAYSVKYKMVLKFSSQYGTTVSFRDDAGDSLSLETAKRWSFNTGQAVTVYFTAQHRTGGYWMEEKLDDIETSTTSSVKPWLPYVSNGKSGLHGWYLQDMGNGTYKEVYFE